MKRQLFLPVLLCASAFLFSCSGNDNALFKVVPRSVPEVGISNARLEQPRTIATPEAILARPQIPILCYHHIKVPQPGWGEMMKTYSVSPAQFAEQMKVLHDSGYTTVLPGQLYNYLAFGDPLPAKSVMLTFDDTDEEQFSIAAKEMDKYGFKGVFFIMTVSINRPNYMTKEQIKTLSLNGHAIESHTWNHKDARKYDSTDYEIQLVKPRNTIEGIIGKKATYFAYPFGVWNQDAIGLLKKAGFKMAFSLSGKRDPRDPLFTVRRMIVPSFWSTKGIMQAMKKTFEKD